MKQFICPGCDKDVYPITLKVIRAEGHLWHEICYEEDSNPGCTSSGRPIQEPKDEDSRHQGLAKGSQGS